MFRKILASPGIKGIVLTRNDVFIGQIIDENGKLTDEGTIQYLDKVVDNYQSFSRQLKDQE